MIISVSAMPNLSSKSEIILYLNVLHNYFVVDDKDPTSFHLDHCMKQKESVGENHQFTAVIMRLTFEIL